MFRDIDQEGVFFVGGAWIWVVIEIRDTLGKIEDFYVPQIDS